MEKSSAASNDADEKTVLLKKTETNDELPIDEPKQNATINNLPICLPLSTRLIGSLAGGLYCRECRVSRGSSSPIGNYHNDSSSHSYQTMVLQDLDATDTEGFPLADEGDEHEPNHHDYNLREFAHQHDSSVGISPLVLAPMLQPSESSTNANKIATTMERILSEYIAICKFYGCESRVNAGVLTTIRFSLPSLRVSGDFHDADMLALAEIFLRYGNGPLRYIKRLDFSRSGSEGQLHGKTGFRSHGAFALSKILQQSQYIQEVRLESNKIGPYGASAIFLACSCNPTVKRLGMRGCRIGEQGGFAFAEVIQKDCTSRENNLSSEQQQSQCGLVDADLSVNRIGFRGCVAIERALLRRSKKAQESLNVDVTGNLVLPEIMNGCTHGLGIILGIVGAILLMRRVHGMSRRHVASCALYSASLLVLYISSTLYHSFFALKTTRYIFEVLDKCAIYILIAGSYTPFISIAVVSHPSLMAFMLVSIWVACLIGIHVEYAYPTWKHKATFSLWMYLGIGWVCVLVPRDVIQTIDQGAINLIVLGGVGYTAGIPFFLRDNFLDHSIWHLFVLAGSFFHWAAVYFYVVFME